MVLDISGRNQHISYDRILVLEISADYVILQTLIDSFVVTIVHRANFCIYVCHYDIIDLSSLNVLIAFSHFVV